MFAREYRRRNRRITIIMITIGISAGLIFTSISDGFSNPMPLFNAVIAGGLVGLYTALIELRLLTSRFVRQIRFIPLLLLRIFNYSIMILCILFVVFSLSRAFWLNLSYLEVLKSSEFQSYLLGKEFFVAVLYSTVLTAIVVFTYQITRKIGPRFLINMITGKYYHPKKNTLIFMFLQITNADAISRKLGLLNYYNFANEIIFDITPPVVAFRAHIYQYVDNEMVIYWYPDDGRRLAACIRTYFAICDRLYQSREKYYSRYRIYPKVQAAMHIGEVVQGEIGHGKTEIDFYGDVLNTTSRMCNKTTPQTPFLISDELLSVLEIPPLYAPVPIGEMTLRGKSKLVFLYEIIERSLKRVPV